MRSKLVILIFMLTLAVPAMAQVGSTVAAPDAPGLRLMNNNEFSQFLKRVDADVVNWKARLKTFNLAALGVEPQEEKQLRSSYVLSVQALENMRTDIRALSRQQSLKLDVMLLVDLNGLARSLDRLSSDLANPAAVRQPAAARKSLGWAREVLAMDTALAAHLAAIQQHSLALAGLMDAAVERSDPNAQQSQRRRP